LTFDAVVFWAERSIIDRNMVVERMLSSKAERERLALIVILAFALVNGLVWSLAIPFDGAPDEIHKYEIVHFIWENHRLPVFGAASDVYIRKVPGTRDGYVYGAASTYPPGAYMLGAWTMTLAPVYAPAGLLYAARASSVMCTVATLYFAYKLVRALFGSAGYALAVTACIALIPQFTYTGAYVGDDAYQIMAVTWGIWATVRGLQEGWTVRNQAALGLALVLATLGKFNGWIAVFPFALLALGSTWQQDWRSRLQTWAVMFVPPCMTLGAWLLRNWLLYQDLFALAVGREAWADYAARIDFSWVPLAEQGYSFLDLFVKTRWLRTMFESFWGYFFYMDVPMAGPIYTALLVGCALGAAATLWALRKRRSAMFRRTATAAVLACAALAFILLFAFSAMTSFYNDYQPQGRYFFPLVVFIVVFLTLGAYNLSKLGYKRYGVGVGVTSLLLLWALNIFALTHYICGHPYPAIPLP